MSPKFEDLTGKRFGRLTVIRRAQNSKTGKTMWLVKCDCGKEKVVFSCNLKKGDAISCGCQNQETRPFKNRKHGGRKTRLYYIWCAMKQRCLNPNNHGFSDYGGRGITICDEWQHDFATFRDWALNNGYSDDLTIDRINNDAGYFPDNCRWATWTQQRNNQRPRKKKAPMNPIVEEEDS